MPKQMREALGDGLLEIAEDEKVVSLDADLSKATSSAKFAKEYPKRFFNLGIAEQNLMGTASGMAISGLKPYASTFAMFATGRAYEQVRNAICYPAVGVKIVVTHAGLSPNADGGSHETIEDIALMRVIPNMTVLSPCDYNQAKAMVKQVKDMDRPVYIRLSRHAWPDLTQPTDYVDLSKAEIMRNGTDLCIMATGIMVSMAMEAAKKLEEKGVSVAVLNIHTIKPIDKETILSFAKKCKRILTAEEHSIIGGLGSAVCEIIAEAGDCKVSRLGINDQFGQSGDLPDLLEYYGLTKENILVKAEELLSR